MPGPAQVLAGGAGGKAKISPSKPALVPSKIRAVALTPDSLYEWVLAVAGGATLLVIAVALQNFFTGPASLTRQQRLFQHFSVVLGLLHGVALLVLPTASPMWAGIGIGMYGATLALFLSAIEAARRVPMTRAFVYEPRCDRILKTGPYRLIRHPVYVASSVAWLAAPVATHNLVLLATAIFMIGCYRASAAQEERLLLSGPLADEFRKHLSSTRRFIPFIY